MMILLETCISVNLKKKKCWWSNAVVVLGFCFYLVYIYIYFWLFFVPFFHILQILPVLQVYCWVFSQFFQKQMRK